MRRLADARLSGTSQPIWVARGVGRGRRSRRRPGRRTHPRRDWFRAPDQSRGRRLTKRLRDRCGMEAQCRCLARTKSRFKTETPVRDLCGMRGGRRSSAGAGNKRRRFAGYFTGATGLAPATSGVTGRSARFRSRRGWAGIPGASGAFRTSPCGDCHALAGTCGDLVRDQRGMLRCPSCNHRDAARVSPNRGVDFMRGHSPRRGAGLFTAGVDQRASHNQGTRTVEIAG
jgi:hypothetical protein